MTLFAMLTPSTPCNTMSPPPRVVGSGGERGGAYGQEGIVSVPIRPSRR